MKLSMPPLLLGLCIVLLLGSPAGAHAEPAAGEAPAARKVVTRKPVAQKSVTQAKTGKNKVNVSRPARRLVARAEAPAQASFGSIQGLHAGGDALALKSSVALVIDQDTNEVLFSKNPGAVLPIASITTDTDTSLPGAGM